MSRKPLTAVLDTSVLIAGSLSLSSYIRKKYVAQSDPDLTLDDGDHADARLIAVAFGGGLTAVFSHALTTELEAVINRTGLREQFNQGPADILRSIYSDRSIHVVPSRRVFLCRDPSDDYLLEAAVEASADFLVSNDLDLLALKAVESTTITSPQGLFSEHEWHIDAVSVPGADMVAFRAREM